MIIVLALAAAEPAMSAIDAERAFAADAQKMGQWTAFRKYAADEALMFVPQAVWAKSFLKGRQDPPKSVEWWPMKSFVSCDGRTAVNTGPAFRPDGTHYGTFTTVWQRDEEGWRWVYDNGGPPQGTPPRAPQRPDIIRATCGPKAPGAPVISPESPDKARTIPEDSGRGESTDKTIGWDWMVAKNGEHRFRVYMWYGRNYALVLNNSIGSP